MGAYTDVYSDVYVDDIPPGPGLGLVQVEILLGSTWTDISAYVYYRAKIKITRGKPNETGNVSPQSCTLQLNNRDGRFSPRNPNGPYYGLIGRNTQIRVARNIGSTKYYRFWGEVPSWPSDADISNTDIYTNITAYGPLRRYSQGTPPTQSAMFRAYTKSTTIQNVVAYWPCEEKGGSASFASGLSDGKPMLISGNPNFAVNPNFASSLPLSVPNGSVWSGNVPPNFTWTDNVVRFLMMIVGGGDTDGAILCRTYTTGTIYRTEIYYKLSNDTIGFRGFDIAGNTLWDLQNLGNGGGLPWQGTPVRIGIALRNNHAGGITYQLDIYPVKSAIGYFYSGTLAGSVIGAVSQVVMGANGTMVTTAVGHISVQTVYNGFFETFQAVNAWSKDGPTDRILRLVPEEQGSIIIVGGFSGFSSPDTLRMGDQTANTFMNMVQEAVDVDAGILFETRDSLSIGYRPRLNMYNQGTAYSLTTHGLSLDYLSNQLSAQPIPQDDDFYVHNDVTVNQTSGTSARKTLTSGALSVQYPPNGVGPYATSFTLHTGTDNSYPGQVTTLDHAGWRLLLGTVNEARYPQVAVNLRHSSFTSSSTQMSNALNLDIGDVIEIDNAPGWLPPDPVRQIIQGYTETFAFYEHDIVFNCSPEYPYRVGRLDDPVLGHCDTDGSTLAASIGTTLNTNGFFASGTSGWVAASSALTQVGPSGSLTPLPGGGYTGFGGLVTANGSAGVAVTQSGAKTAATAAQVYYVSALVYNPTAAHNVSLGLTWYNSGGSVLSTSSTAVAVTAATWTALSYSFTAPASTAFLAPVVGLSGTPANGEKLYVTAVSVWQGAFTANTNNANSPLWTTSSGSWPFDIVVGGERMTVTAVSGSSSPQTLTVARSVNGVIKAQASGASIALFQPMIVAL